MQKQLINSFAKNDEGAWVSIEPFTVVDTDGTEINVSEGIIFKRGTLLMGIDWSRWLDTQVI